MVKLPKTAAGMVEDTVQHHADAAFVGFIQQEAQGFIAAQQWVYIIVIVGMVAVIGRRGKDRVEVNGSDPQVFQVIQFFGYAIQVAAFKAILGWGRVPGFEAQAWHPFAPPNYGGVAAGEAVGKDLVENGVLYPVRCGHL